MKILIVEDEPKIGGSLQKGLSSEGYECHLVKRGFEAMDESSRFYDLALVDIMIPDISGIEVAKKIKEENPNTKVIFLTSKSNLSDKLEGFEVGGDDYIIKPFSFEELLARIRAVLKRVGNDDFIEFKGYKLDLNQGLVIKNDCKIKLSKTEFDLLKFLIINNNRVYSKEELIEKIWGFDSEILPNTVEVFIKSLRDKIEKPFKEVVIETVRGFGYKITNV